MEYTPPSNSEQDESDKDDEKLEKKKKKTTKIARAMPIGVRVDPHEVAEQDGKPAPVLSISDRFMQQLEARAAKKQETEAPEKVTPKTVDKELIVSPSAGTESDTTEVKAPEQVAVTELPLVKELTHAETPAVETATWSPEGEFGDDGEIELKPRTSAAKEVLEPTTATESAPIETGENFVEVPIETGEMADMPDTGPVEPELLEAGLAAEGPPEPPEDVATIPAAPGDAPRPIDRSRESVWYDAADMERTAKEHEQAIEDAAYYGEKRGLSRGVGAGLFFGWLFGRHGKKKAELRHNKELKSKNKEIMGLKNEQFAAEKRLQAIKQNQDQIRSVTQQEALKRPERPENEPKKPVEAIDLNKNGAIKAEIIQKAEVLAAKPPEFITLQAAKANVKAREQEAAATINHPEIINKQSQAAENPPAKERLPEDQAITEEAYEVAAGKRVETSAWHRIEIDEKTGKAVGDPEVAYGKEFKHEQRQEIFKDNPVNQTTNNPVSFIGGVATTSAAISPAGQSTAINALPQAHETQGSLEVPRPAASHEHLTAGNQLLRYASNPLVWVWAIIIVATLFIIGILR